MPNDLLNVMPHTFQGLKVIVNPNLTKPGPPEQVRRTWRERWTTWPWRPWVATKTVVPQVPDDQVYQVRGAFVMHPAVYHQLKAEVDRMNMEGGRTC